MLNTFMTKIFGASWRTTLWGGIAVLSAFITQYPDLVGAILEPAMAKKVFSISALISGFITFSKSKDKNVTGGTIPTGEKPTEEAIKTAEANVATKNGGVTKILGGLVVLFVWMVLMACIK
jgi:hypothetical protein